MNMCVQKCKEEKKDKQVAQSKQGKHNIAQSGERVCIKQSNTTVLYFTSGHSQISHRRDGCNHTRKWPQRLKSTSPQRAQSMAKPRSRHENMEIKHRSKKS